MSIIKNNEGKLNMNFWIIIIIPTIIQSDAKYFTIILTSIFTFINIQNINFF